MKEKDFHNLLKSIDQARAIRRGGLKPSRIYHYEPVKVKAVRAKLGLTQSEFAALLCVSRGTLRNWEQGRTYPEGAAITLLRIAESNPRVLLQTLHAA